MHLLGISGSLRRDSHNRKLLHATRELLPADVELSANGHEVVQMPGNLLTSASRKERQHARVVRQSEGAPRRLTTRHRLRTVEQRVADERCVDPMLSQ